MKGEFNRYIEKHASAGDKKLVRGLPKVGSWSEVRQYLRADGMSDEDLARVRALWRAFWKSASA